MAKAVVIGADKGIANRIARRLAARGDRVTATLLGEAADFEGAPVATIPRIDVTDGASLARAREALQETMNPIDVLYHVAGVMTIDALGSIDYDTLLWEFKINAVGPLRTIETLLPLLSEGSKVGIVTSRVGSLGDNGSGGQYSYRMSKCAANMAGVNLHHDLKKIGVAVRMLHPGMVKTDLVKDYPGDFNYITPEAAAEGLIAQMDALTLASSGDFRHANGDELIW